jgi:hypothetical protein
LGRRKRGWKRLSKFSLGDLQRMVEAKQAAIAKLASQREAMASDLAELDADLAAAGGGAMALAPAPVKRGPGRPPKAGRGPGRPKGRRGRRGGPKGQSDLHNAIRAALKGSSEPMKLADIAAKVKAGGYKTKSASFPVIVGQRLTEMKDAKKAGHGLYALK